MDTVGGGEEGGLQVGEGGGGEGVGRAGGEAEVGEVAGGEVPAEGHGYVGAFGVGEDAGVGLFGDMFGRVLDVEGFKDCEVGVFGRVFYED